MDQKGFVNILVIVLVVAIAGIAGYFALNYKSNLQTTTPPTEQNSDTVAPSQNSTGQSNTIPEKIAYKDEIAGIGFERPNKSMGLTSELGIIVENGMAKGLVTPDIDVAAKRYAGKYFGFPDGIPSGADVSLNTLTINGQEARLISGNEPRKYFVLFLKLPKIAINKFGSQYSYYAFSSSDKIYLDQVIPTVTFLNPVKDEEKVCSTTPKFEQYQVSSVFNGAPKVDLNLDVWNHYQARDPIAEGSAVKAKGKPDFAGYYTLVSSGCGTSCNSIGAVDLRTGAAYAVVGTSGGGINYNINSKLFSYSSDNQTRYYLWENNASKLLCVSNR